MTVLEILGILHSALAIVFKPKGSRLPGYQSARKLMRMSSCSNIPFNRVYSFGSITAAKHAFRGPQQCPRIKVDTHDVSLQS